jgi:hypothetical protein
MPVYRTHNTAEMHAQPRVLRCSKQSHDPLLFRGIISDRTTSLAAIISREAVSDRYITSLVRLAFFAPKIVELMPNVETWPVLNSEVDLPFEWKRVVGIERIER